MKKLTTLLFALMLSTSMAFAQNNEANISQTGGNDNQAKINQNTGSGTATIESTIKQVGSHNSALTNASRENDVNSTTLQEQKGENNKARINLSEGSNPSGNEGTVLTQVQKGNGNFASMEGQDSYRAEQRQKGNNNVATTSKNGKNGDVFQLQVGNDNLARAEGLNFSDADQRQYGDHNISTLENLDHSGPGESYTTRQDGQSNTIRLFAGSNGGVLDASQTGDSNFAKVTWSSAGNTTNVSQNGNSNSAVVTQN